METVRLNVPKFTGNPLLWIVKDAELVAEELRSNIKKDIVTVIDFNGAEALIPRFVTVAIGNLLGEIDEETFDKYIILDLKNEDSDDRNMIERNLASARQFYRQKKVDSD